MLSSKGDAKQEARFAARLDVLLERVDTLAATVANTASAIAKKDGEIAALQRAVEARDQTLHALVEHVNRAAGAQNADVAVDATELRSLRNAVAALTKERASGVNAAHIESLVGTVRALGEQVQALSAAAAAPAPTTDPATLERIESLAADLDAVKSDLNRQDDLAAQSQRVDGLSESIRELERKLEAGEERASRRLASTDDALAKQAEGLDALAERLRVVESGRWVDEEQLDRRFAVADDALTALSGRLDAVSATVESATVELSGKEHEVADLHRNVTESNARVEAVVEDIREALHAFPEQSATTVDELAARLERLESATRRSNETAVRAAGELTARIESIEHRVSTVAEEVSRAKTLWPVALRSLEARLDDALHPPRAEQPAPEARPSDPSDDLLAGLRDSLEAMESVAAEIARASETLSEPFDETAENEPGPTTAEQAEDAEHDEVVEPPAAAAGGATIVPLRAGDP